MILCAIVYDLKGYQRNRRFWECFTLVALILLAGLRFRMGTDSIYYESEFATWKKIWELDYDYFSFSHSNLKHYAPLYIIFCSFLRSITSEFVVVQLIYAIFINSAIFYAIKTCGFSKYLFTIVLFYFVNLYYNLNTEVLRESIAVGIFLFSIEDLYKRRYKTYYLKAILAIGFHFGAFFLLVLPLLRGLSINKTFIAVTIIIALVFPIISKIPVVDLMIQYASGEILTGFLAAYASDIEISSLENGVSINLIILQYLIPLGCCLYIKKIYPELVKYDFMLIAYMLIIWANILYLPIFSRFCNYTSLFYYAFLSATIIEIVRHHCWKSWVVYLLVLVPFSITAYNSWVNAYVDELRSNSYRIELIKPYTSVLNPRRIPERETIFYELRK